MTHILTIKKTVIVCHTQQHFGAWFSISVGFYPSVSCGKRNCTGLTLNTNAINRKIKSDNSWGNRNENSGIAFGFLSFHIFILKWIFGLHNYFYKFYVCSFVYLSISLTILLNCLRTCGYFDKYNIIWVVEHLI